MYNDNITSNTNTARTSTRQVSWDATKLQQQPQQQQQLAGNACVQIGRWRQQLHTLLHATARELHYKQ